MLACVWALCGGIGVLKLTLHCGRPFGPALLDAAGAIAAAGLGYLGHWLPHRSERGVFTSGVAFFPVFGACRDYHGPCQSLCVGLALFAVGYLFASVWPDREASPPEPPQ